ncbi:MAG: membrane-bound metal-dependent hydrolase YbcI (DUF457 family) [Lentimonas sp.]|jgi:membrane-bound metal-dependent hydrolase YbcI (DUF457 family)
MCSPIGHTLAGLTTYYALRNCFPQSKAASGKMQYACFAILIMANLPDTDLTFSWLYSGSLVKYHQVYTHNIFFLLAASLIAAKFWPLAQKFWQSALIFAATLGSHLLLDSMVGRELWTGSARGIPLLWPISSAAYAAPITMMPMLYFGKPELILTVTNANTLIYEALVLTPLLIIAIWTSKLKNGKPQLG